MVSGINGQTSRARYLYYADGNKYSVSDANGNGYRYRGSFVYNISSTGEETLESVGYDEVRLIATYPSSTTTQFIDTWHVKDYLGSVRVILDITNDTSAVSHPSLAFIEQNDYLPFGTRVESANMAYDLDNRYRYNGKEEQVIGNIGLIDYGARFYDPDLSRWTTPDPLAEKYYSTSPYAFCNNNPVNFVDLDGRSWYYNSHTGHFVAHIDDDDDYIYLISPDEICRTNGDNHTLSSYRRDDNIFGQLVLEGFLDESIVNNVISDLFDRANVDENGTPYISIDMPILANSEINAYAEIKLTNQTIKTIEINPTYVYKGYDSMLIFAHEIGHLVEINNNTINNNVNAREISADKFARGHWVYKKASNHIKEILHQHENQHH